MNIKISTTIKKVFIKIFNELSWINCKALDVLVKKKKAPWPPLDSDQPLSTIFEYTRPVDKTDLEKNVEINGKNHIDPATTVGR